MTAALSLPNFVPKILSQVVSEKSLTEKINRQFIYKHCDRKCKNNIPLYTSYAVGYNDAAVAVVNNGAVAVINVVEVGNVAAVAVVNFAEAALSYVTAVAVINVAAVAVIKVAEVTDYLP